jgi:allophanate hydrolase
LLVVGAHLSGQPLNHELLGAGGTLVGPAGTAPRYRLFALDTVPPKPGLVRGEGGASIAGELWRLPAAGFARFMTALAAPMAVGRVCLADGRDVLGFLCEPLAVDGATDITSYGGWRAWRASLR